MPSLTERTRLVAHDSQQRPGGLREGLPQAPAHLGDREPGQRGQLGRLAEMVEEDVENILLKLSTTNVLFIMAGSFAWLDEIVGERQSHDRATG